MTIPGSQTAGGVTDARPDTARNIAGALPDWVKPLAGLRPWYQFAPCDVFRGRAVAAVRMAPGAGPHVVITADEGEMRAALGIPTADED
ncbi:MAG: hypothetical protein ABSA93_30425 [Streptosporangiaceae bacterium]